MLQRKAKQEQGRGSAKVGKFCKFQSAGQRRPHCKGELKGERKETMQTFGGREFQAKGRASSKSWRQEHAWCSLHASVRIFSCVFYCHFHNLLPILGHPNILGIHIQTLVTTGSLFYSQYPNGDQIILILLATHYKFFCFSIFPLSPYQPYNDRNYRTLGL